MLVQPLTTSRMETNMTLMKDAPLPTFGKTITEISKNTLRALVESFGFTPDQVNQKVVKSFVATGDRIVGVRVEGPECEGLFFISADQKMIKTLRTKLKVASDSLTETDVLFKTAFDLFKGLASEFGCDFRRVDDCETQRENFCTPDEWLVSQLSSESGTCWISFGYSGKLPFAADDERIGATEAKDMTFF